VSPPKPGWECGKSGESRALGLRKEARKEQAPGPKATDERHAFTNFTAVMRTRESTDLVRAVHAQAIPGAIHLPEACLVQFQAKERRGL